MRTTAKGDFELLDEWRAGDRDAGDKLLRRHFDSLYCFFRNKVDVGLDDLIQRTFLALVKAKDQFRKQSSFRTYLFTVARHELYRHYRELKRERAAVDLGAQSVEDLGTSPSRILARRTEQQLLLAALRKIPVDLQIAIELHYWEGFSTAAIAEVLGIPQGTAKSRLRRAREALEVAMTRVAATPDVRRSTAHNFERWAQSIRRCVAPGGDAE
ncbi:MAG: RNA polymerase sigma factor [Myxococcales bacterium]|nr:RNA polymerase sigma factor [Myxococcales bacterium]MCB9751159.1 RNA polymerase sigma factor [Myxococcales bacterium]